MNARVHITSPSARVAVVNVWGFDMDVEFDYEEGEAAILWPTEQAHPGSPPNAVLLGCRVGGVQIVEMLKPEQTERIEEAILEEMNQ